MKTYIIIFVCSMALVAQSYAQQTRFNLGGGYFGNTVTHPGLVLEFESERIISDKASLPVRVDLGFYVHPRNHSGLFVDVSYGFRRYFKSGFFLEESIGFGILETFVNSDGTFSVDENGTATETSSANPPDFMPSITLGLGYNLTKDSGKSNLIWLRPKLSWQIPEKTSSVYHPAIQVGFTHTIATK
jgi:hypothetical protein